MNTVHIRLGISCASSPAARPNLDLWLAAIGFTVRRNEWTAELLGTDAAGISPPWNSVAPMRLGRGADSG